MNNLEQTLSIIKPDAVERKLDNEIKEIFKNKGFLIKKEKKIQIEKSEAEKFYKIHETKPFYDDLCTYLSSGPIVVMVLENENAVLKIRELMEQQRLIVKHIEGTNNIADVFTKQLPRDKFEDYLIDMGMDIGKNRRKADN